ncbi:MAG: AGE family epimerase/isomerase [Nocardioidaceae bacterium]
MSVTRAAQVKVRREGRGWLFGGVVVITILAALGARPAAAADPDPADPSDATSESAPAAAEALATAVPAVLTGDAWLRHVDQDLRPYWDSPEALGEPVGNYPSLRGRNGEVIPETPTRGLVALARQVYGYCVSFMLTGEDRYLGYAKAGIDWIEAHAEDPTYGGYYAQLDGAGDPVNPLADKEVFDLASVGLAYGIYFDVTRDPDAERHLLAIRDMVFDKYYDAANHRMKDSLTFDLTTEVDTSANGEDITDLLVPATAIFLANTPLLSDADRRAQFKADLRELVSILIARHKNDPAPAAGNRFYFWGASNRFGKWDSARTDFGHNLLSYAVIYDANLMFADQPWDSATWDYDRERLIARAWDSAASRWSQQLKSFSSGNIELDGASWIHNEADQLLATLDLYEGVTRTDQVARSAQSFLDVYVDRDPAYPARETFARVTRNGVDTDLRKSALGKGMLHNYEHALVMFLYGRMLEGAPARLYYAFPADQALTAVARPYWFTAATETRTVTREVTTLPGHRVVEVAFSGIGQAAREPWPAPADTTAPATTATVTPPVDEDTWTNEPVTVDLAATDDLAGVKEIHVLVHDRTGLSPDRAAIQPGDHTTVTLDQEGDIELGFFAVDLLGNQEAVHTLRIGVDTTAPTLTGLPVRDCSLWPPDNKLVTIADLTGADTLSGVAGLAVDVTADEPIIGDVVITAGRVEVRATRDGKGDGRVYTVTATVTDRAGNATTGVGSCTVPHDRGGHR